MAHRRIALHLLTVVVLISTSGCTDKAALGSAMPGTDVPTAAGIIRVSPWKLQGLEGRMLAMGNYTSAHATRIEYAGPKQSVTSTVVVYGFDGAEETRRSLGSWTAAAGLDQVFHVSVQAVPTKPRTWFLHVRQAGEEGSGGDVRTYLELDEWMPEGFGSVSVHVPTTASEEIADDKSVTIYRMKLTKGNRRKTVAIEVSLR